MEDRLIARRQHRERVQEYKETAAKTCYSLIIIVAGLVLLRPVMVNQMLGHASAYSDAGLLDESMRQCDKALLIEGDSSEAWQRSAQLHKALGDREMAYGAYQRAVQSDLMNRSARLELAVMHIEDDQHQMAVPYLEQVRRLGPDRAAGYGRAPGSCHRGSLELLILCYEKMGNAASLELVLKEARIFYPGYDRNERHSAQAGEDSGSPS